MSKLNIIRKHYRKAFERQPPVVGGESYIEDVSYLLTLIGRYDRLLSKLSKWNDNLYEMKKEYGIPVEEEIDEEDMDDEDFD